MSIFQMLTCLVLLAVVSMLTMPLVWAQSETKRSGAAAESIEGFKDEAVHGDTRSVDLGYEKGNLHEHGVKELLTDGNFEAALEASASQPVIIFKHSTQCEISGGAYRRLAKWIDVHKGDAPPLYLVKVIERRPVSQHIEARLKVKHESPQIILLNEKKVAWHASHEAIDAKAIDGALEALVKEHKL